VRLRVFPAWRGSARRRGLHLLGQGHDPREHALHHFLRHRGRIAHHRGRLGDHAAAQGRFVEGDQALHLFLGVVPRVDLHHRPLEPGPARFLLHDLGHALHEPVEGRPVLLLDAHLLGHAFGHLADLCIAAFHHLLDVHRGKQPLDRCRRGRRLGGCLRCGDRRRGHGLLRAAGQPQQGSGQHGAEVSRCHGVVSL